MTDVFLITAKSDKAKFNKLASQTQKAYDLLKDKSTPYAKQIKQGAFYYTMLVDFIETMVEQYEESK